MKLISLALATSLMLAGYAQAQTPAQAPTGPSAQAPASSSGSHPLSKECKKEVKDLCGRAHGQEMQDCVKSGLDMNKFSADCKTSLMQHAKPKS
jgi:hypothetical protein